MRRKNNKYSDTFYYKNKYGKMIYNMIEGWDDASMIGRANTLNGIKGFLRNGADVNYYEARQQTLLARACQRKNAQFLIKSLICAGADVNFFDLDGNTPLHYACAGKEKEYIKLLLDAGAWVDYPNNLGRTPMGMLAGDLEMKSEYRKMCRILEARNRDREALRALEEQIAIDNAVTDCEIDIPDDFGSDERDDSAECDHITEIVIDDDFTLDD